MQTSDRKPRSISPERYRRVALTALFLLVAIVITGGAVRLTGSGLGCSDWPTCEENQLIPDAEYHALIEFINRLITGVVSAAVIVAVLASRWRNPVRADLTRLSWGLVGGVLGQIILGAFVVLSHLNPWLVLGHFSLSMVLIWNAVLLVDRAGLRDVDVGQSSARVFRPQAWIVSTLTAAAIFLGTLVTGSGPHAGSRKGELIERLPFDVADITRIHGISVIVLLAAVVSTLAWSIRHDCPPVEVQRLRVVLAALMVQGAIGYTQYFTGVPALLVGFHIAGATALWIAVIWYHVGTAASPIDRPQKVRIPASAVAS